jgi:hypothetical protein
MTGLGFLLDAISNQGGSMIVLANANLPHSACTCLVHLLDQAVLIPHVQAHKISVLLLELDIDTGLQKS